MFKRLSALIGADGMFYAEFGFESRSGRYAFEHPVLEVPPEIEEVVQAGTYCATYPLCESLVGGADEPLRLSDYLGPRARQRNPFYREVLSPLGIEHELKLFLPAPDGFCRGFDFSRGRGRDFDERDRALLALLRPHFARLRQLWVGNRDHGCLTSREEEIIRLVASGLRNREIAEQLTISTGTVRKHLDHIYDKLGVHTRTAAVAASTPSSSA